MSEHEQDKIEENGAVGGGVKPKELPAPPADPDFEALRERLEKLNKQDRRRTLSRLSKMFAVEEVLAQQNPSELHDSPLANDQNFDNVLLPGAQNWQGQASVVVHQSDKRTLPRFSGADKLGQSEVTFRRWQRAATRLVEEESITDDKKKDTIFRSLQGKADDIADLHRHKTASEILNVLEKKYGGTIDGDELLVDFYQILQGKEQTAGDYLSDLFVELGEVVKFDGLAMDQMPKVLLKQFIRGTTDEDMLTKLRLEDKIDNPPQFPDFISSIRREESKRTERRLRHKKQAKVQASIAKQEVEDPETLRLRQRVVELEAIAAKLPATPPASDSPSEVVQLQQRMAEIEKKFSTVRGRNVFCYRCGEDAHLATDCQNPPNRKLVEEKVAERRKRRQNQLN
jgi:hypothetical protein